MTTETLIPIQREFDSFQQQIDRRFREVNVQLDKCVTLVEYKSDNRSLDVRFKDIHEDIIDLRKSVHLLDIDFERHFNELQAVLKVEEDKRRAEDAIRLERKENLKKEKDSSKRSRLYLFLTLSIPALVSIITTLLTVIK